MGWRTNPHRVSHFRPEEIGEVQERRRRLDFGMAADPAGHDRPPATTRLTSLADARIKDAKPLEPPGRSKTTRSALPPTRIAPERSGSARRRPRRAISKIARAVAPPFIRATRYANSISRNMEGTLIIALSVPSRSRAPDRVMRGMSGVIPKKAFDRGHKTIGTAASAHRVRSASV